MINPRDLLRSHSTRRAAAADPFAVGKLSTVGTIHSLDALRGMAAMAVVLFHLGPLAGEVGAPAPGQNVGQLGVHVFFVLSGFLIATSVLAPERFSRRDYAGKRMFRILPNYWFSMVLVVLLLGGAPFFSLHGMADVGTHVLLVHGWFKEFRASLHGVWWTLSIEWLFYLAMLVVAPLFRRGRAGWTICGAMIVGALAWRGASWLIWPASPIDLNFAFTQLPGMADLFAAGMVAALLVRSERARDWLTRRRAVVLVVGLAITVASVAAYRGNSTSLPGTPYWRDAGMVVLWPLTFATGMGLLVLALRQYEHVLGPIARRTGLAYLGLISYSIYLYHPLVIRSLGSRWSSSGVDLPGWMLSVAIIAGTIVFSALIYHLVECPGLNLRRHIVGQRTGRFAWLIGGRRHPDPDSVVGAADPAPERSRTAVPVNG